MNSISADAKPRWKCWRSVELKVRVLICCFTKSQTLADRSDVMKVALPLTRIQLGLRDAYRRKLEIWFHRTLRGGSFDDGRGNHFRLEGDQFDSLKREATIAIDEIIGAVRSPSKVGFVAIVLTFIVAVIFGASARANQPMVLIGFTLPLGMYAFRDSLSALEIPLDFARLRNELAVSAQRLSGQHIITRPSTAWYDLRNWRWKGWGLLLGGLLVWFLAGASEILSRLLGLTVLLLLAWLWIFAGKHRAAVNEAERQNRQMSDKHQRRP